MFTKYFCTRMFCNKIFSVPNFFTIKYILHFLHYSQNIILLRIHEIKHEARGTIYADFIQRIDSRYRDYGKISYGRIDIRDALRVN